MHLARSLVARGGAPRHLAPQIVHARHHPSQIVSAQHFNGDIGVEMRNSSKDLCTHVYHQRIQTRFRRHDRASAFTKPRPPTKKQRKEYNRKMKRLAEEASNHNPPGYRAGPRRQWEREQWQHLLDKGKDSSDVLDPMTESSSKLYGFGDALLDDLMGNTSHLTSQPTPEPVYVGHNHVKYFKEVAGKIERYRSIMEKQQEDKSVLGPSHLSLPSDTEISNVLRAYRDLHGTKSKPIGISMALEHLLKDLGIPLSAFGEFTFTTLLTCSRTPKEARRILKLMDARSHPISSYSYSILADIHAKRGDYLGCYNCIQEMITNGLPPTQAAYTSLLAACYKICNDGRIAHSVRAEAGEFGWSQWQEMFIVGIEPDAMAYGAIIRLCAARGHPERAINLLQDMDRFGVKPTTLCFSSALRAVARSHSTAIRFENGSSRKQLRRESIAAHHGMMARAITIMAENAEVDMDDGFVSALIMCAAAAGDSATSKAVYLASKVRSMDHLRTIGSESHLQRLQGVRRPDFNNLSLSERSGTTAHVGECSEDPPLKNLENALASGQSTREPDLETTSKSPSIFIPQSTHGEREYGRDSRILSALIHAFSVAASDNGIGTLWAGSENQGYLCENSLRLITTRWKPSYVDRSIPGVNTTEVGIAALRRYDEKELDADPKPGVRKKFRGLYMDEDSALTIDELDDTFAKMFEGDLPETAQDDLDEHDDGRHENDHDAGNLSTGGHNSVNPESFSIEALQKGEEWGHDADEKESHFDDMNTSSRSDARTIGNDFRIKPQGGLRGSNNGLDETALHTMMENGWDKSGEKAFSRTCKSSASTGSLEVNPGRLAFAPNRPDDPVGVLVSSPSETDEASTRSTAEETSDQPLELQREPPPEGFPDFSMSTSTAKSENTIELKNGDFPSDQELAEREAIRDLSLALPGLPMGRLKRIRSAFTTSLTYPSLLALVPLLREKMPDYVSSAWLKKMNTRNAEFALGKAVEDGIMDVHVLNAILQVKTSAGSLDKALEFHRDEFRKNELVPTAYSDRLVVQMLLRNKRIRRALDFKQNVEESGRTLDIPSYGSLVEYCARHNQLGSAMLLLRECIAINGAPPSEKYVAELRILCRQQDVEDIVDLGELVGDDPVMWLKHGEKFLKRDKSKKGRRNVLFARNRLL